jgi:hypothetical protein
MMHKFGHTPYIDKQIVEFVVASLTTNIVFGAIYVYIRSQNDLTPHEHVIQSLHIVLGKVLFVLVHLFTLVIRNCLPIQTAWPYAQHSLFLRC